MNSLKKTIYNPTFWIYTIFICLHLALFNINTAEWGDSFRILRASNYIRVGSYPPDEKRPPLFSAILAVRPANVDQLLWARIVMVFISVLSLYVFRKVAGLFIKDIKYLNLASVLFALNPVYLYWSIRIMADVPLSILVLSALLFFYRYLKSNKIIDIIVAGFLTGLSILTRYEGYLLFISIALGILLNKGTFSFNLKSIKLPNIKKAFIYALSFSLIAVPYLLIQNPLTSEYLSEPVKRTYYWNAPWIYVASLIFVFGFISAIYVIGKKYKLVKHFLQSNVSILVFLGSELLLTFVWPAAIPRLFISIIPFLIIIATLCFKDFFEGKSFEFKLMKPTRELYYVGFLLFFYIATQYFLRVQFLVTQKEMFALVVLLQIFNFYFLFSKKFKEFTITVILSMSLWAGTVIWLHKDIYIWTKSAALYAYDNLCGKIVYNDKNAVVRWYLYDRKPKACLNPVFYDTKIIPHLDKDHISDLNTDYLLLTTEDSELSPGDVRNKPYLQTVKEFRYNVGGRDFFTAIYKVKKDQL